MFIKCLDLEVKSLVKYLKMNFWIIMFCFKIVDMAEQEMSEDLKKKFADWMVSNFFRKIQK